MLRDYEALLEQDQDSTKLLKDSIEYVLGVPYLKIAKEDLSFIEKQFEKERNKLIKKMGSSNLQEVAENLQSVMADIEDKEKLITVLKEQKDRLRTEILAKKRELADLSEVRDLAQSRLNLEMEIKDLDARKSQILAKMQIKVSGLYKTLLIPPAQNVISKLEIKSNDVLEAYNKRQELKNIVSRIEKDIAEQKCSLCGAILDQEKVINLEKELKEAYTKLELIGEVPEPPMDLVFYKKRLQGMISEAVQREDFVEINKDLSDIDYKIAVLSNKLTDIENKLSGIDSEMPKKLEIEIQDAVRELGRIDGLEEAAKEDLTELIKTKGEWERIMASIPQKELDELNKKIYCTSSLVQVFDDAISKYRDERRSDIEKTASEILDKLGRKMSLII